MFSTIPHIPLIWRLQITIWSLPRRCTCVSKNLQRTSRWRGRCTSERRRWPQSYTTYAYKRIYPPPHHLQREGWLICGKITHMYVYVTIHFLVFLYIFIKSPQNSSTLTFWPCFGIFFTRNSNGNINVVINITVIFVLNLSLSTQYYYQTCSSSRAVPVEMKRRRWKKKKKNRLYALSSDPNWQPINPRESFRCRKRSRLSPGPINNNTADSTSPKGLFVNSAAPTDLPTKYRSFWRPY